MWHKNTSFLGNKKGPDFSVETVISFVCNFLSSSAGFNLCSCFFPAHPCLPLSFPTFSRPSIPRLIAASFPLSDPRCFGILSSASVLDSDYSAFRSFFSLLPVLPCRRFLRCFFPLPSGLFPCLPSDSGTQPPALLFSDHWLASQWLLQCLRLLPFGLRLLPLCFRFRFWLLSFRSYPYGYFLAAAHLFFRSNVCYTITRFSICQQLFCFFSLNLYIFFNRSYKNGTRFRFYMNQLKKKDLCIT